MSLLCGVTRFLASPCSVSVILAREASKKAGSSSKNLGGKSPGRRYGVKKMEGDFVHAGNILATQRLMRWHPGSQVPATLLLSTRAADLDQVGIGRNNSLYALEDGIVRYTKEVYIPSPRSDDTLNVICKLPVGAVMYKTFINVIPKPKPHSFKLVDMM